MGLEVQDVLGIKPFAEAAKTAIEKSFNGLGAFLEAVFMPGLQEFGFLMKDQVRTWRLNNALRVMDKAKGRLGFENDNLQILANARVGLSIIEESSMVDDEELQNMWAGLFASSCTPDGKDDSNIIFVDILKRMSVVEARVLKYACEHCRKTIYPNSLIVGETLNVTLDELKQIAGTDDIYRLDRELDHMTSLSLFLSDLWHAGGFSVGDEKLEAEITPTPLALNFYYKANALNTTPTEFWKDTLDKYKEGKKENQ